MKGFLPSLKALDGFILFHPERWPGREWIGRITALTAVTAFLWVKWHRFDIYPGSYDAFQHFYLTVNQSGVSPVYGTGRIDLLWSLRLFIWTGETATLLGYLLAYVTRAKALATAGGIRETLMPVVIAGLPVLISMAPYSFSSVLPYSSPVHFWVFLAISGMILCGTMINLWALLTLRRAFSIMPESRYLVTSGLYRYVRHPIYLGHFILMSGVVLIRCHWYTLLMFSVFCAGQYWRALLEEKKLAASLDGYSDYVRRTGMFFPLR